jgi:conjugative transfer signal peptidase TraF
MAELARFPATACGEALRAIIAARRERMQRARIAVTAALAAVPCIATVLVSPQPLLLWNASASTPRGLYRVDPGASFQRGDSVATSLAEPYRSIAARRGYLPSGVPLVKRIVAVPGDRVCAQGAMVSINGKMAAVRNSLDALGRALPAWSGCRDLGAAEYLVLGESPWSFDGRYFGATDKRDIIGRAVLLWRA